MMLQIDNLDCTLGGTRILSGVSLQASKGDFIGLTGPNGCGKSTLLKHVYKALRPQKNVVFLDGKDVTALPPKEMAQSMSVMAQENPVEFDIEVLEMVMYGRYSHRKFLQGSQKNDTLICKRCIRQVGLEGYEHRSFLSLSGGEKQRTLLARALAQESRLIVLDEPTNHLDVRYQYLIMQTLKNQGITVFSAIHDLNLAAMYCDKIILMDHGTIVKAGTPEEVITEENLRNVFKVNSQVTVNATTGKIQVYYLPERQQQAITPAIK